MCCATGRSTSSSAVELFNQGLDISQVDTVRFLRPTESATVFLQSWGARAGKPRRQTARPHSRVCSTLTQSPSAYRPDIGDLVVQVIKQDAAASIIAGVHRAEFD
jgi:superfamily II DNA or RNA helicase